jgi:hypothetical protein
VKTLACSIALTLVAWAAAPAAQAQMALGNYDLNIEGRYDFHTWLWSVSPCPGESLSICLQVEAIGRPVAKAFNYRGTAQLADGRYTLTVNVPDGLRCGNIYYGPVIPTRDTYSWDATTLMGSLNSSFETGCDGAPGGAYTYPFTLSRL